LSSLLKFKGGIYLYIRKRIPGKDDPYLINIVTDNFKVRPELVKRLLENANEVLVACDDNDKVAGFVSYRFRLGDMVYVDYVVLDYKYQGKGIATSFLPVFEKHFYKKGIRTIYGTVDEENREALALFKRWGFKVKGKIISSIIIEEHLSSSVLSASQAISVPSAARSTVNLPPAYRVRKLTSPPQIGVKR
jgi:GNAT superfamily N-acetyltransferase